MEPCKGWALAGFPEARGDWERVCDSGYQHPAELLLSPLLSECSHLRGLASGPLGQASDSMAWVLSFLPFFLLVLAVLIGMQDLGSARGRTLAPCIWSLGS